MVGENIQNAREKLQSMRGQFQLGEKLFSSNPGILSNLPMGKRVSERIQSIRGMNIGPLAPKKTTGVAVEGVSTNSTKKVVSV